MVHFRRVPKLGRPQSGSHNNLKKFERLTKLGLVPSKSNNPAIQQRLRGACAGFVRATKNSRADRMIIRSFSRSFQEVIDAEDCLTGDQASARKLADSQPGRWKVWSYRPLQSEDVKSCDCCSSECESPVLTLDFFSDNFDPTR